jgi:hypothetical protein
MERMNPDTGNTPEPKATDGDLNDPLYLAALEVEKDEALAAEMAEWDLLSGDALTESEASRRPE